MSVELYMPLRPFLWEINVGEQLDQSRARRLAAEARYLRNRRKELQATLRTSEAVFEGKRVKLEIRNPALLEEEIRRYKNPTQRHPRGKALWIIARPGERGDLLPTLSEIADLRDASLSRWAEFVRRYGLLEFTREQVVAFFPDDEEHILRVPLDDLRETAWKAVVLVAADEAARGDTEAFSAMLLSLLPSQVFSRWMERRHIQPSLTPSPAVSSMRGGYARPREEAAKTIAAAIEEAFSHIEASFEDSSWVFYTRGCWPRVVLANYLPHGGQIKEASRLCRARDCSNSVPKGRRYCSERCRQREKKRRRTYRKTDPASS